MIQKIFFEAGNKKREGFIQGGVRIHDLPPPTKKKVGLNLIYQISNHYDPSFWENLNLYWVGGWG